MSFFQKLKTSIRGLFGKKSNKEQLEEILIKADFGYKLSNRIAQQLDIKLLQDEITKILKPLVKKIEIDTKYKPFVITLCGVNGSGKTTTAAKLAYKFQQLGLTTSFAACDTFRAAGDTQLEVWASRLNCPIYKSHGHDPASVVFDALSKTQTDVLIVDTAGRLPNNTNLMEELAKIFRVIKKLDSTAPHINLMIIDATTGQNAIEHVKLFNNAYPLSGLVLTKIDGGAKGGMIVQIADTLQIPIFACCHGESVQDLSDFSIDDFLAELQSD